MINGGYLALTNLCSNYSTLSAEYLFSHEFRFSWKIIFQICKYTEDSQVTGTVTFKYVSWSGSNVNLSG